MAQRAIPATLRKRSNRFILLLALVFGVISAVLVAAVLSSQDSDAPLAGGTVPTVVAAKEIKAGTTITADMLELKQLPKTTVLPGAFTSSEQVMGKVTRYPLAAGEQVLANKIVAGKAEGLAFVIPEGKRAVFVPVVNAANPSSSNRGVYGPQAFQGLIAPGDFVDVLVAVPEFNFAADVAVNGTSSNELQRIYSASASGSGRFQFSTTLVDTLFQDVQVLALGQTTIDVPATGAGDDVRAEGAEADKKAVLIALALTLEEAQRLFHALMEGQVFLVLRRFGDHQPTDIQPYFRPLKAAEPAGQAAKP